MGRHSGNLRHEIFPDKNVSTSYFETPYIICQSDARINAVRLTASSAAVFHAITPETATSASSFTRVEDGAEAKDLGAFWNIKTSQN